MAVLVCARFESPVGPLLAVASDRGLCGLPFVDRSDAGWNLSTGKFAERRRRWLGTSEFALQPDHPIITKTGAWLDRYFAGAVDALDPAATPPLDLRGANFERQVWNALLAIPIGTTTSYGEIARRIGSPGAARAVGLANGANPVPIIVPCHRVIGASGALTGYGGGLPRKTFLLEHERRHWGATPTLQFT